MEHIPTTESDVKKVCRIARALDISLEDTAITCAGFELAFGDGGMRRGIFEIIDRFDASAAKKGEPLGLIINYTVDLGMEGIRVGRYADEWTFDEHTPLRKMSSGIGNNRRDICITSGSLKI